MVVHKRLLKWGSAVGLALLLILAGLYYLGSNNQQVKARATGPQQVIVGVPFTVTITLDNETNNLQEIVSIGVEQAALQNGLTVLSTLPDYRTTDTEGIWTAYVFARRRRPLLNPNANDIIRLTLVVSEVGRHDTEMVLWFNNQLQGVFVSWETEALPHPAPWLGQ